MLELRARERPGWAAFHLEHAKPHARLPEMERDLQVVVPGQEIRKALLVRQQALLASTTCPRLNCAQASDASFIRLRELRARVVSYRLAARALQHRRSQQSCSIASPNCPGSTSVSPDVQTALGQSPCVGSVIRLHWRPASPRPTSALRISPRARAKASALSRHADRRLMPALLYALESAS